MNILYEYEIIVNEDGTNDEFRYNKITKKYYKKTHWMSGEFPPDFSVEFWDFVSY